MSPDTAHLVRSLRSPDAIKNREEALSAPHIAALRTYVEGLRNQYPGWEFPDFDPYDGGQEADILFLLEKPGPKTSIKGGGSGFISRDNDDATAAALFNFMQMAGIPRQRTVLWNSIPGWNGTIKMTAAERRAGLAELPILLTLLPKLKAVILVGRKAQKASVLLQGNGLQIAISAHPSPKVRSINRPMWDSIPKQWQLAFRESLER
ncbi:uracil-DNA glycosylase [Janthinobacterium sp. GB4P2]|uniref:uracil-DNA glycosylase n=1 Tax=Janthinobacterium sp. GB4P2 TaxID=3424189 RepID=UPI003F250DB9